MLKNEEEAYWITELRVLVFSVLEALVLEQMALLMIAMSVSVFVCVAFCEENLRFYLMN